MNNISVSSIHTNQEDKCNPIKHCCEKESQPVHRHLSIIIRKEKTEAVPKATTEHQQKFLASIGLSVLSKQKEIVRQVIEEKCDVFSGDDDGVGDMNIKSERRPPCVA